VRTARQHLVIVTQPALLPFRHLRAASYRYMILLDWLQR